MAKKAKSTPARPDYNAIAHELYEIDALLAGAAAIIEGFRDDSNDPDDEALNALKLVRRAKEGIPSLAQLIADYGESQQPPPA